MMKDIVTEFSDARESASVRSVTGEGETAGLTVAILMLVERLDNIEKRLSETERLLQNRLWIK